MYGTIIPFSQDSSSLNGGNQNLKYLYRLLTTVFQLLIIFWTTPLLCQTIADTFDTAEIPTYLGAYSSTCNGPLTTISITLPSGGPWTVTGIDIAYNMTAQGGGLKSHQRSYIRCQNTATSEATVYQGTGNGGVQAYSRTGVNIANGSYSGNTVLHFEMRAWRTAIGSGCSSTNNRVDNFTWIINVHYGQIPDEGSVGIGTTSPATSAILDLTSTTQAFLPPRMTTQQRDAIAVPVAGMMIFNTTTQNLEIFTSGWGTMSFSTPGVRRLLGGSGPDYPYSMYKTSDGGFIVGGSSGTGSGTFPGLVPNGGSDFWIFKLNNTGNIVWEKLLGGSNSDDAYSIQQTTDGGFIVAGSTFSSNTGTLLGFTNNGGGDAWIIKLNNNGNVMWQKLIGGSDTDYITSIQQTSEGGYIAAGSSFSSNSGSMIGLITNGLYDAWILKLDANGLTTWQKLIGGAASDYMNSIQQTSDGGFIMAGSSSSSNTGTLLGLINNGVTDGWILKMDNSGNTIWQKLLGGSSDDYESSIQQTSDGGMISVGYSNSSNSGTLTGVTNNGSTDGWILKLDDSGNTVWQKLFGGSLADITQSVKAITSGDLIIAGSSNSSNTGTLLGLTNNGGYDNWILKLNSSGLIAWQRLLGGTGYDNALSVQQTTDGGFIISGNSDSSNSGNLTGLFNNGNTDAWIYKLDSNGNLY